MVDISFDWIYRLSLDNLEGWNDLEIKGSPQAEAPVILKQFRKIVFVVWYQQLLISFVVEITIWHN